jgi:hypothetical protein
VRSETMQSGGAHYAATRAKYADSRMWIMGRRDELPAKMTPAQIAEGPTTCSRLETYRAVGSWIADLVRTCEQRVRSRLVGLAARESV